MTNSPHTQIAIRSRGKGRIHILRTDDRTLCGLNLAIVAKNAQVERVFYGKLPVCLRCEKLLARV